MNKFVLFVFCVKPLKLNCTHPPSFWLTVLPRLAGPGLPLALLPRRLPRQPAHPGQHLEADGVGPQGHQQPPLHLLDDLHGALALQLQGLLGANIQASRLASKSVHFLGHFWSISVQFGRFT